MADCIELETNIIACIFRVKKKQKWLEIQSSVNPQTDPNDKYIVCSMQTAHEYLNLYVQNVIKTMKTHFKIDKQ